MKLASVGILLAAAIPLILGRSNPPRCRLDSNITCPPDPRQCAVGDFYVCGRSDQRHETRTFRNCCALAKHICKNRGIEGWHSYIDTSCAVMDIPMPRSDQPCNFECTRQYAPVCAANKRRERNPFYNECFVREANCKIKDKSKRYRVVNTGHCVESPNARC